MQPCRLLLISVAVRPTARDLCKLSVTQKATLSARGRLRRLLKKYERTFRFLRGWVVPIASIALVAIATESKETRRG